jgi:hypothetical protein
VVKLITEQRLLELKEYYKHKKNRHRVGSMYYSRYSGKIEAINDIIQESKGNRINMGGYKSGRRKTSEAGRGTTEGTKEGETTGEKSAENSNQ